MSSPNSACFSASSTAARCVRLSSVCSQQPGWGGAGRGCEPGRRRLADPSHSCSCLWRTGPASHSPAWRGIRPRRAPTWLATERLSSATLARECRSLAVSRAASSSAARRALAAASRSLSSASAASLAPTADSAFLSASRASAATVVEEGWGLYRGSSPSRESRGVEATLPTWLPAALPPAAMRALVALLLVALLLERVRLKVRPTCRQAWVGMELGWASVVCFGLEAQQQRGSEAGGGAAATGGVSCLPRQGLGPSLRRRGQHEKRTGAGVPGSAG